MLVVLQWLRHIYTLDIFVIRVYRYTISNSSISTSVLCQITCVCMYSDSHSGFCTHAGILVNYSDNDSEYLHEPLEENNRLYGRPYLHWPIEESQIVRV